MKKQIVILNFENQKIYTTNFFEVFDTDEEFIEYFSNEHHLDLNPTNCQWMIIDEPSDMVPIKVLSYETKPLITVQEIIKEIKTSAQGEQLIIFYKVDDIPIFLKCISGRPSSTDSKWAFVSPIFEPVSFNFKSSLEQVLNNVEHDLFIYGKDERKELFKNIK